MGVRAGFIRDCADDDVAALDHLVARLSSPKTPDNCADVTFWDAKPIDYKHLQERGFVVLKSSCSKTFKDLPVFATCTRSDKDEHHAPILDAVAYYYDLATVGSDETYRGQCLGNGGSWRPRPPTTRSPFGRAPDWRG